MKSKILILMVVMVLLTVSTVSAQEIIDNLHCYYNFSTSTPASFNSSCVTGTNSGATHSSTGDAVDNGGYFSFDGGDSIALESNPDLNLGGKSFSLMMFVKTSTSGEGFLWATDVSGSRGVGFKFQPSAGKFRISDEGTGQWTTSTTAANNDAWALIGVTWDSSTKNSTIYFNGMHDGSEIESGAFSISTAITHLGKRAYGGAAGYYTGFMDEVGFWKDRVLTYGEVLELYNNYNLGIRPTDAPIGPDNTAPLINLSINNTSPKINEYINISFNVSDNIEISEVNMTTNGTLPSSANYTIGAENIHLSNSTQITLIRGNVINITVTAIDSSGNYHINSTVVTVADTLASRSIGINGTTYSINDVVNVSSNVTDADGLAFCLIKTNQTGVFTNNTFALSESSGFCSDPITISAIRGNVINFTVEINDTVGGFVYQNSTTITVANSLPNTSNIVNDSNGFFKTNQTFNITQCNDADGDTCTYSWFYNTTAGNYVFIQAGQTLTSWTTNLTDGTYGILVNASDDYGANVTSDYFNFTIDSLAPVINTTLNKTYTNINIGDVINYTANITDLHLLSFCQIIINQTGPTDLNFINVSVEGQTIAQCSNKTDINLPVGGVINFTIKVNDSAGNWHMNDTIITISNSLPNALNIVNISNGFFNRNQTFNSTSCADADGETCTNSWFYNNTDGNYVFIQAGQTLTSWTTNLTDGTYGILVNASDNVANVSSNFFNFTIDSVSPVVNTTLNKSYTNIKIGDVINYTANITDLHLLSFCQIIINQTGPNNIYIENISIEGQYTAQCSNKSEINLVYGNVINFTIRANDSANNWKMNDTIITVANTLNENLTIYSPSNYSIINRSVNLTYSVFDNDEGIVCNFTISSNASGYNPLSGVRQEEDIALETDGEYDWNLSCIGLGDTIPLWGNGIYIYDTEPNGFLNNVTDASYLYPGIGDIITINITVNDEYNVSYCDLWMNDTQTWEKKSEYEVKLPSAIVSMSYTIQNYSTANQSHIGWYARCNDTAQNYNVSEIATFDVVDTSLPLIIFYDNNTFKDDGLSIVSSELYDLYFNVGYFDFNLFQAMINITCEVNDTIFYWEVLDYNNTNLYYSNTIDLDGYNPQKCTFYSSSSDDHTDEKFAVNNIEKISKGIDFETTDNTNVIIETKENTNTIKEISTNEEKDRVKINFEFTDKQLERKFTVDGGSDVIYSRYNSNYPGHVVIWDDTAHKGTWVDFAENETNERIVKLEKITNNEYDVIVTVKVPTDEVICPIIKDEPKEIGKLNVESVIDVYGCELSDAINYEELIDRYGISLYEFNSIGGTNVENISIEFYIGAAINLTGINRYDGSVLSNFNVTVTTENSNPGWNGTGVITGTQEWLENVSNGTYTLFFQDTEKEYFNKSYIIDIQNQSQNVIYNVSQAILNILISDVKSGLPVIDSNVTLNDTISPAYTFFDINTSEASSYYTYYINKSLYDYAINNKDYIELNGSVNMSYQENLTLELTTIIVATFILYDERTLELFNITSADTINFLLYCPGSTETTVISNTTTNIFIDCPYDKFKFVLDYGVTSYYRTFIIDPDDVFEVKIYLIDLTTTNDIYNSFILDDLFNEYDNPSVFIKKLIGNTTSIITSDWVDIENKIGAYLIENHEYTVEVHSDNLPTRVIGSYSADISGEKAITLYNIEIDSSQLGDTFDEHVTYATYKRNYSVDTVNAYAIYEDRNNETTIVVWTLREDTPDGPIIYTYSTTDQNFEVEYNISPYLDTSVYSTLDITHSSGNQNVGRILNDISVIVIDAFSYLSTGFLNWFFLIFLGVIAIMATIKTGNYVAIGLVGFASLFVIFGWFTLSSGVLVLAILVALVSLLKQGDKQI